MSPRRTRRLTRHLRAWWFLACVGVLVGALGVRAAPLAGTRIGNQAVASYLDGSGVPRSVTSNLVETLVTAVPGVTLVPDNSLFGSAGSPVSFPHRITNSGNISDTFALALSQLGGDDYDLLGADVYLDANDDGVADDLTSPVATTPSLAPGESLGLVVEGKVPAGQPGGDIARLQLVATSTTDGVTTAGPVDDDVTVSAGAVFNVTKQLSANQGPSPSGGAPGPGYVVTLRYTHTGSATAPILRLTDTLPVGMAYRAGGGRWSGSGAAVLTEAGDGTEQTAGSVGLDYSVSGAGVTAVLTNVPAGSTGFLRFTFEIPAGVPAGRLLNTAQFEYDDSTGGGTPNVGPLDTNTVPFDVLPVAAVDITAANSPIASAPAGSTVVFRNVVTNLGTATDSFDVTLSGSTFPPGTILTLYRSDGSSLLLDTDGSGLPDTGPLAAGATYDVFLRAQLPVGGVGGGPYQVDKTARSRVDPTVTDTDTDVLTTVSPPTITPDVCTVSNLISDPTPDPGDTVTFTVTWQNSGTGAASPVPLIVDAAPASFVLLRVGVTNTSFVSAVPPGSGVLLYHQAADPQGTYVTVPPINPADVDHVAVGLPVMAPAETATLVFDVTIDLIAPQIVSAPATQYLDPLLGTPSTQVCPPSTITLAAQPPIIEYFYDPTWAIVVDHTPMNRPLYVQSRAPTLNLDPFVAETATITIVSQKTGDTESYTAIETGPNTAFFQIINGGGYVPTQNGLLNPVVSADGTLQAEPNDLLTATISAPVGGTPVTVDTIILIDPAGIVFDSRTGQPVAGARVTLIDVTGTGNGGIPGDPAVVFEEGGAPAPSTVLTGADGRFRFPLVFASTYLYQVQTPAGFTFASVVPPGSLPPGFRIDASGSYGGNFPVSLATGAVFIDVPVDSSVGGGLLVQKTPSREVVELGESLDYTVVIRNTGPLPVTGGTVTDVLPRGFRYQRGSTRLGNGTFLADPIGSAGSRLVFRLGVLAGNSETTLVYRVQVGAGAQRGAAYNTAQAAAAQAGVPILSNLSRARVRVRRGVFTDRGVIFGRVWVDSDRDDIADDGEPGVPGVRIFLEDGTFAITDIEGKYSLHGIDSRTHVARVDPTTLPPNATFRRPRNRHGDRPWSRFVDIRGGELYKANFAIDPGCDNILENVAVRRRRATVMVAELEQGLGKTFLAEGPAARAGDARSRPAAGLLGGSREVPDFDLPAEVRPPTGGPAGPAPAPPEDFDFSEDTPGPEGPAVLPGTSEDYAELAKSLSSALGFVNLRDGDLLPSNQTRIQIKGHSSTKLQLLINGAPASRERVGARVAYKPNKVQLIEYVGVPLEIGSNVLTLRQVDGFGNTRGEETIRVRVAGPPENLELTVTSRELPADGKTPVRFQVRLTDAEGLPVPTRVQVTLEADGGRLAHEDPAPGSPGVQAFVSGGEEVFTLLAPDEPGPVRLRVSLGELSDERQLTFSPPLRPLILVGVVEGKVYRRKLNLAPGATEPLAQGDPFEREFVDFFGEGGGSATKADIRAAFYLKGKIRGDALLTVSYDSEKEDDLRLFRDIQPEEFYPIYGDSSIKGYDAQSTSKLYVRVDRGTDYFLYGDFDTRSRVAEPSELGAYTRSMTGGVAHHEGRRGTVTAFASRGSQRQVVEEIPANGTSGPFFLRSQDIRVNSEKVEVLVRDRDQPAVILSTIPQTRFRDYALEPFSGRILFKAPLPSVDENLNPRSVRITYERDQGGTEFWRTGLAGEVAVGKRVRVGGSFVDEDDPLDSYELKNLYADIQLGAATRVVLEAAASKRLSTGRGNAQRFQVTHRAGKLEASVRAGTADATFDNPNAPLSQGREELRLQATYRVDARTAITAESLRTGDRITGAHRTGHAVGVVRELAKGWALEAGLRHVEETASPAQPSAVGAAPADFTSARLKLSAPIGQGARQARLYTEYEQDLGDSDKRLFALGGDVKLHEKTRLYARHELISTLGGRFALNTTQSRNSTIIGLESEYMKDGRVFSEYRGRDAFAGRETEAAIGLRNLFHLGEGLRLNTTFERIKAIQGSAQENLAFSVGLEFTRIERLKATTRLEFRDGAQQDSFLGTIGAAYLLDRNWSTLGRYIVNRTTSTTPGLGDRVLSRLQLGFAYRPVHDDRFNGLLRFERRVEDDPSAVGGGSFRDSDVLSMHLNYNPNRRWVITSRYASRWTDEFFAGLGSNTRARLVGGRVTYEVAPRWDLTLQAARLFTDGAGAERSWGLEVGRMVGRDFWLALGYNFAGFSDPDLVGEDYTERGVYFRLRAKFDEYTFRRRPAPALTVLPEDCDEPAPPEGVSAGPAPRPSRERLPDILREVRREIGDGPPRLAPSYAVGRSSLIRLLAPPHTTAVTAVFPWGETKHLEARRASNYWEARFSVPESAPHGVYDVALLVRDGAGEKRRLDYVFQADRTEPEGHGSATKGSGGGLLIDVGTSPDVRRAEVILPGGEYLALEPDDEGTRWSGRAPVQVAHSGTLPVVLYDTAHNMMMLEIEVDE